jgi:hypothetical protein
VLVCRVRQGYVIGFPTTCKLLFCFYDMNDICTGNILNHFASLFLILKIEVKALGGADVVALGAILLHHYPCLNLT